MARLGHELDDDDLDFFDGVVIETARGRRFIDADQIGRITRASVQTTVTDIQADSLPEPHGTGVYEADPEQYEGTGLTAWFGRMFRREHWTRERDE